jgi:hypothetical protein
VTYQDDNYQSDVARRLARGMRRGRTRGAMPPTDYSVPQELSYGKIPTAQAPGGDWNVPAYNINRDYGTKPAEIMSLFSGWKSTPSLRSRYKATQERVEGIAKVADILEERPSAPYSPINPSVMLAQEQQQQQQSQRQNPGWTAVYDINTQQPTLQQFDTSENPWMSVTGMTGAAGRVATSTAQRLANSADRMSAEGFDENPTIRGLVKGLGSLAKEGASEIVRGTAREAQDFVSRKMPRGRNRSGRGGQNPPPPPFPTPPSSSTW